MLTILEVGDLVPFSQIEGLMRPGESIPQYRDTMIVGWHRPEQGKWKEQLLSLVRYLQFFAVDTIAIDATGMGDPIAEQLADMIPGVNVVPVNFNVVSKDFLYKRYLQEVSTARCRYAAGPKTRESQDFKDFVFQHETLEKVYHGRYMCPQAPEGGKDDFCDSAALAVHASTVEVVVDHIVEYSDNPFYSSRAEAFKRNNDVRADRYRR